jgi:hypothetical protein
MNRKEIEMSSKVMANIGAFILFTMAFATPALAGDQTGNVVLVGGDNGNPFVFTVSGTRTSRPACATDDSWVIPSQPSDNAKGLLSLVITALASHKTIIVHGNGGCDAIFANREEVASLWIQY